MRKPTLNSNHERIMQLKAKMANIDQKIKKAKEIHSIKQQLYDTEKAFIDSLECDAHIKAIDKSISKLIEDANCKDIDEYIKNGEHELNNLNVQTQIQNSYDEEMSVTHNKEIAIKKTVTKILNNIKHEHRTFIKEKIFSDINNFKKIYETGPSKSDLSSEEYINVITAQLTYNTIACIIASELTLLILNDIVEKSVNIDSHFKNYIERAKELDSPLTQQGFQDIANIFDEDVKYNTNTTIEKYEIEINNMMTYLLRQHRYLTYSAAHMLFVNLFDLPFLHDYVTKRSNFDKWVSLCSQYLIALNLGLHDTYRSENDSLEHEFSLAMKNDKSSILLHLLKKYELVDNHSLTRENIQAFVEKADDILMDFIQSTKALINASKKLLNCKGSYLTKALTILENGSGSNC